MLPLDEIRFLFISNMLIFDTSNTSVTVFIFFIFFQDHLNFSKHPWFCFLFFHIASAKTFTKFQAILIK